MSLKITVEVDGQTEQQLAPLVSQWALRSSSEQVAGPALAHPPFASPSIGYCYSDNSALLQQQIQQLVAQNQLLQAQLSQQRLIESAPGDRLLSQKSSSPAQLPAAQSERESSSAVPLLPIQYRTARRSRFGRSLGPLMLRLWHSARVRWKGFLLFCLLSVGIYGALGLTSKLAEQTPAPEFTGEGPGEAISPTGSEAQETEPPAQSSTSPTSKAGSHPPPPPAFEQP